MDFYRYHGLGNDYLVMDPQWTKIPVNPETVRAICEPHFGEGSDGILYGPLFDDQGQIHLRIFNPDGSEAEKSGNGTRIFARYLVDQHYVSADEPFSFVTLGGVVTAHVIDVRTHITMYMGQAKFLSPGGSEQLLVDGQAWNVTCVSMGNPHCVIPVDSLSKELVTTWGPKIETHKRFKNRTNVQFLQVLDRRRIQIEIWERGAGYTLASGSSSCAAVAAAHHLGLVDDTVSVEMPGGILEIAILPDYEMQMTGPVVFVSKGLLSEEIFGEQLGAESLSRDDSL